MSDTEKEVTPRYIILTHYDAEVFCRMVSRLMGEGWTLHGDLKLQVVADLTSATLARLTYVQALCLYVDVRS